MASFKTDINDNVNKALTAAAKKLGMSRQKYIELKVIKAHAEQLMIDGFINFGVTDER